MDGARPVHEDAVCPALAKVIDFELGERMTAEIGAAFQSICSMILLRTVQSYTIWIHAGRSSKTEAHNKRAARKWVEGGTGVLTFETVCETLDLDPEYTREGIKRHAERVEAGAIRKSRKPNNHIAFGRSHVEDSFAPRADPPAG